MIFYSNENDIASLPEIELTMNMALYELCGHFKNIILSNQLKQDNYFNLSHFKFLTIDKKGRF